MKKGRTARPSKGTLTLPSSTRGRAKINDVAAPEAPDPEPVQPHFIFGHKGAFAVPQGGLHRVARDADGVDKNVTIKRRQRGPVRATKRSPSLPRRCRLGWRRPGWRGLEPHPPHHSLRLPRYLPPGHPLHHPLPSFTERFTRSACEFCRPASLFRRREQASVHPLP